MTTRDWQGVLILSLVLVPLAYVAAIGLAILLTALLLLGLGAAVWDGVNKHKIDQMKAGEIPWSTDQKFLDLYADYIKDGDRK